MQEYTLRLAKRAGAMALQQMVDCLREEVHIMYSPWLQCRLDEKNRLTYTLLKGFLIKDISN